MTQHVLIGVGGSGQHVLHAYLRMLALTFPLPQSVPHVFIIDADAVDGHKEGKRSHLVDNISRLHSLLVRGHETPSLFRLISPVRVDSQNNAVATTLTQLLSVDSDSRTKALAHGFLADDDSEWGSDWAIELTKGMMANPKVGSVTIAHKVEGAISAATGAPGTETDQQLRNLIELTRGSVRIAIVGSNFGGTGSGVIPALVRQLDRRQGVEAIRAFMCLPWFGIDATTATTGRTSAARMQDGVDPMVRNSSLGLHTYLEELTGGGTGESALHRSSYVLVQSMSRWPAALRKDDGNYDQSENRHVINLAQAAAIQAFFGLWTNATTPNGRLYSLKTAMPAEAEGHFDASKSPHLRFWAGADESIQLDDLAAEAEVTAFVLEKAGRIFQKARKGKLELSGVGELKEHAAIDQFMRAVAQATGMPKVQLGLFYGRRETADDAVFSKLGEAMLALSDEIRASLIWLDGHSTSRGGQSAAAVAGIKGVSSSHLFIAPEFGNSECKPLPMDDDNQLSGPWKALKLTVVLHDKTNISNASPTSQAIGLFNSVFTKPLGEQVPKRDPVEALVDQFSKECQLDPKESGLTVAARVIGRAIHKHVIDSRTRHTDVLKDERQRNGDLVEVGEKSGVPMLMSELAAIKADDCRLARIDLKQEMGENSDEFHPAHPMSLAYIDPYTHVRLENGNVINLGERVLPEHGLRGIPNIAAPLLLQRWRLNHCRPEKESDYSEPLIDKRDGKVRGTRHGVYLHALRVNEAAFWLIVSGDARVKFAPDLFNERIDSVSFGRLLRNELKLSGRQKLPGLVFTGEGPDAGKPLFLWGGDTWYLAANSTARRFFGALVTELPSVRYGYRPDNPLEALEQKNAAGVKALDRFFANQIRRAIDQVPASLVTRNTLRDLYRELAPLSSDEQTKADDKTCFGEPTTLWLRSNTPAELSIHSHQIVSSLRDYFCKPAVVFMDSKQESPAWNGLLPMRAEVWSLLEGKSTDQQMVLAPAWSRKVDAHLPAARRVDRLRLEVRGLGRLEQDLPFGEKALPLIQEELQWDFGVWPSFKARGWHYYIISGTSRIGDPDNQDKSQPRKIDTGWLREGMDVALVVKGRKPGGEGLEELGRVVNGLARRIEGVPEVLELVVGNNVLGSRRIDLEEVKPSQAVHLIGIDFGTSNTCMAVQLDEQKADTRLMIPLLPGGKFADRPTDNLLLFMDSSRLESSQRAFLTHAAGFFRVKNTLVGEGEPADTLPSELLVSLDNRGPQAKRQGDKIAETYTVADLPLADLDKTLPQFKKYPVVVPLLTPLPPYPNGYPTEESFRGWLRLMVSPTDQRVKGDLKWPGNTDDNSIRASRAMRAAYIEQVVVSAFAVLCRHEFGQFGGFVAMQPEAVSDVRKVFAGTFKTDVEEIVTRLAALTGIRWDRSFARKSRAGVCLVSESQAALYTVGRAGTRSAVSILTVDIGGGTTDVGVSLRGDKDPVSLKYKETRFTASARFAGNSLLEAVAQSDMVRTRFYASDAASRPRADSAEIEALKSMLKSELRRRGGKSIGTEVTAGLASLFLDGVFEYAFGVLRALMEINPQWLTQFTQEPDQRLQVLLLGNGFRLFEAFQVAGERRTLTRYCEDLKKRLVDAGLVPAALAERMEFDTQRVYGDAGKTQLIQYGGMDAANAAEQGDRSYDPEAEDNLVLLPPKLASHGPGSQRRAVASFTLLPLEMFRTNWLGADKGSVPTYELTYEVTNGDLRKRFPLTYAHWEARGGSYSDDLHSVFHIDKPYGGSFLDTGALYLAGNPKLLSSKSYAWLMTQYAKEKST